MKDSHRIVICGDSIYMLAIESGISALSEGEVVRVNPDLPNKAKRISYLDPHVVITEQNGKNSKFAQEMLGQRIPLILLDEAQRTITVQVREPGQKAEISELSNMIEKINRDHNILLAVKIS